MTATICTGACRASSCDCQGLRDGETLIENYCQDCSLCDCAATRKYAGIPCIAVAHHDADGTDRCVRCGVMWTAREYGWQPSFIIRPSKEQAA